MLRLLYGHAPADNGTRICGPALSCPRASPRLGTIAPPPKHPGASRVVPAPNPEKRNSRNLAPSAGPSEISGGTRRSEVTEDLFRSWTGAGLGCSRTVEFHFEIRRHNCLFRNSLDGRKCPPLLEARLPLPPRCNKSVAPRFEAPVSNRGSSSCACGLHELRQESLF